MKSNVRWLAAALLLVTVAVLSTGCLLNVFQTAKMLQSGDVGIVIGSGLLNVAIEDDPVWTLTPQARMAFGLSDKVNLGLHTGAMVPLSTGDPGWLGVVGDLKFALFDDPESVSVAIGFGGGYGLHFIGWGVFAEAFLDLNVFPLYFAYRPTIPLSGEDFGVWHDVAIGMSLALSENARILVQVDTRNLGLWSYGLAFEVDF